VQKNRSRKKEVCGFFGRSDFLFHDLRHIVAAAGCQQMLAGLQHGVGVEQGDYPLAELARL
jgi:hypothetical protein